MIIITSRKHGFRRCGIAHPATPTQYGDDHFDRDQLRELQAEPMLVVEIGKHNNAQPKTKPEDDRELLNAIVAVIGDLDRETDFTKAGRPRVEAVEAKLGYNVSGEEVSAAFDQCDKDNK